MATRLKKRVRRETIATPKFGKYRNRPIIIVLEAPNMVTLKIKGTRQSFTTTVESIYDLAHRQHIMSEYNKKVKEYQLNKKLGMKNLRKPKKPIIL